MTPSIFPLDDVIPHFFPDFGVVPKILIFKDAFEVGFEEQAFFSLVLDEFAKEFILNIVYLFFESFYFKTFCLIIFFQFKNLVQLFFQIHA